MRWFIIGLSCTIIVLGAGAMVMRALPPSPTTPEASVAATLDQHAISFERVELRQGGCVPAPEACQVYVAEVVVWSDKTYVGRVECEQVWERCRLWVADLGLNGASLPPVGQEPMWKTFVRRLLAKLSETAHRSYRFALLLAP